MVDDLFGKYGINVCVIKTERTICMKKTKKIITLCLIAVMTLSVMNVVTYANDAISTLSGGSIKNQETADMSLSEIRETYEIARELPHRNRDAISLMRAYTTVTVTAVCDSDWLAVMSSEGLGGLDDAEFIIDEISEFTEAQVGVQLYGYAITANNLTANDSQSGEPYIDEAWSKYGKGTRDMMIAFYRADNLDAGGWAYYGKPKCALFLQDYDSTWKVGRHETGHMYNVYYPNNYYDLDNDGVYEVDGDCLRECVINNDPYKNQRYNKICSECLTKWTNESDRYPE